MKRWLGTIVLSLVSVLPALAFTNTYYYSAKATASPTGGGTVYVGTSNNTPDASAYANTKTASGDVDNIGAPTITFHYYAKPEAGYSFSHWADGSATGQTVSTSPNFNDSKTISSTSNSRPTSFNYFAVFTKQTGLVKVASSNPANGTASIDNPNNGVGDVVTLTAFPDLSNGVLFRGWSKGTPSEDPDDYVFVDNPHTMTVTAADEDIYYANFSEPETKIYCRIQNKKTGRFISIYGNTSATIHTTTEGIRTVNDGFVFTNSFKLISETEAFCNPNTVFFRSGHSFGSVGTSEVDFIANREDIEKAVQYTNLVTPSSVNRPNCLLTLAQNADGSYKIYTTVTLRNNSGSVDVNSYFCDTNDGWLHLQTREFQTGADDWYIYVLGEDTEEGAFAANAKSGYTADGKYYTSMFTAFPYKLLDGVKAYYLPLATLQEEYDQDNNIVPFTEITSGIVPANTAVILECPEVQNESGLAVTNRLLPLTEEVAPLEYINGLQGYVSLNGETVANNKEKMYVFSSKDGKLGFYHSSKASMTPNKAYILLPELTQQETEVAQNIKFRFGTVEEDTPTVINLLEQTDDEDAPIYDLMGRRVQNAVKGIFIQNGKKFIKK